MDVTFDSVQKFLEKSHRKLSIIFNDSEKMALFDKRWTVKRVAAQSIKILSASTEGKYTLTDGQTVFPLQMTVDELPVDRVKIVEVGESDPLKLELPDPKPVDPPKEERSIDSSFSHSPTPQDTNTEIIEVTMVESSSHLDEPSTAGVVSRPIQSQEKDIDVIEVTMVEGAAHLDDTDLAPTPAIGLVNVDTQESYRLDTFPAIVGRKDFNPNPERVAVDLKLQTVSREHARIFRSSHSQFSIENLSSSKPIAVNGAMIPSGGAPVVLSEGDMLSIGDVNLRVLIDE